MLISLLFERNGHRESDCKYGCSKIAILRIMVNTIRTSLIMVVVVVAAVAAVVVMIMVMMMVMIKMASPWLETSSWWQAGTERHCP